MTVFLVGAPSSAVYAEESDSESFASIAARASQISKEIDKENAQVAASVRKSEKTAYDFELPVEGSDVKFSDIIKQEFFEDGVRVKAILVVNIKQDDPIARKAIPELISLATKYGRNRDGALAIVACPTYVNDCIDCVGIRCATDMNVTLTSPTPNHAATKDTTNPTLQLSFVSSWRRNMDMVSTQPHLSRTR